MNYMIGANEFRVILDVFEKHIHTLSEEQLAELSWDPEDIVIDMRKAKILGVIVTTAD